MKTFRGKEVIGWKIITGKHRTEFEKDINNLMEQYNFEDFQFSTIENEYSAAILISEK